MKPSEFYRWNLMNNYFQRFMNQRWKLVWTPRQSDAINVKAFRNGFTMIYMKINIWYIKANVYPFLQFNLWKTKLYPQALSHIAKWKQLLKKKRKRNRKQIYSLRENFFLLWNKDKLILKKLFFKSELSPFEDYPIFFNEIIDVCK